MNGCFGCDPANPVGLGITFAAEPDGRLVASWVPHRHHVGIGDVVNGGLLSLLAEELAAAVAAREWDGGVVVIRTESRFHRPARVQTELLARPTRVLRRDNRVTVDVSCVSAGIEVLTMTAEFRLLDAGRMAHFGVRMDQIPACITAGQAAQPGPDQG